MLTYVNKYRIKNNYKIKKIKDNTRKKKYLLRLTIIKSRLDLRISNKVYRKNFFGIWFLTDFLKPFKDFNFVILKVANSIFVDSVSLIPQNTVCAVGVLMSDWLLPL